ncbi:MAG: EAL domain-containing protein [Pseudomonadota bacterium]
MRVPRGTIGLAVLSLVLSALVAVVAMPGASAEATAASGDAIQLLGIAACGLSWVIFALQLRADSSKQRETDQALGMTRPEFVGALESALHDSTEGALALVSVSNLSAQAGGEAWAARVQNEAMLRLLDARPVDVKLSLWPSGEIALLFEARQMSDVRRITEMLIDRCSQPISIGVRRFNPDFHVGAVELSPGTFERSDQAIRAARVAVQSANQTWPFVQYDRLEHEALSERTLLAQRLPRALYDRTLSVYLQPSVSMRDSSIYGFEALARWSFNGRLVEAEDLVAAAASVDLQRDLDAFVVDEAIRTVADWNRRRETSFALSVNLSSVHFLTPSGVRFISDSLAAHGFTPGLLTVEVSDTEFLSATGRLAPALQMIRGMGCRLSIDDFGVGHSTLSDLCALPLDEIKIDGGLVHTLDGAQGQAVVRALLAMARELKIATVMEGVETEAQRDTLLKLGCSRGQGFLFGHPRPALEWLSDATFGTTAQELVRAI